MAIDGRRVFDWDDGAIDRRFALRRVSFGVAGGGPSFREAVALLELPAKSVLAGSMAALLYGAPVLFAVQLDWSVSAFDMAKVPPLAIFNAYTLYTTEANREGRTWYGLRLGFFSDAVSAKQVAYYVRSDFKTVSVVPVTTIEKERANDINAARSGIHRAVNVKEGPAPTMRSITSGAYQHACVPGRERALVSSSSAATMSQLTGT